MDMHQTATRLAQAESAGGGGMTQSLMPSTGWPVDKENSEARLNQTLNAPSRIKLMSLHTSNHIQRYHCGQEGKPGLAGIGLERCDLVLLILNWINPLLSWIRFVATSHQMEVEFEPDQRSAWKP
jgi:hypothetical protein